MNTARWFLGILLKPHAAARHAVEQGWGPALLLAVLGLVMIEVFAVVLHGVGLSLVALEIGVADLGAALASLGFFVLMLIGGLVATGAFAVPWGAGDEPVRTSVRRGVRLMCWTLPHLATLLGAVWLMSLILRQIDRYWPWEAVNFLGSWLAILLWTVTVIRVVSVGRSSPRCRWPATCRGCGYSLVGRPSGDACPECGTGYDEAVGRGVAGPPWTRGGQSWVATTLGFSLHPRRSGSQLLYFAAGRRGGRFAVVSALLSALIAALFVPPAVMVFFGGLTLENVGDDWPWVWGWGGLVVAVQVLLLTTGVTMGLAFGVGSIESLVFRRNVLPLAAQAAEYLGGTMTLLALIYGAYLLLAAGVAQALSAPSSGHHFIFFPEPPPAVGAVLITLALGFPPTALAGLAYLHWQIVAAGRWNNA